MSLQIPEGFGIVKLTGPSVWEVEEATNVNEPKGLGLITTGGPEEGVSVIVKSTV